MRYETEAALVIYGRIGLTPLAGGRRHAVHERLAGTRTALVARDRNHCGGRNDRLMSVLQPIQAGSQPPIEAVEASSEVPINHGVRLSIPVRYRNLSSKEAFHHAISRPTAKPINSGRN